MRTPPLLADFSHARPCKPFCENSLTLPQRAEGEARAVMPQGAGQGLHIHSVLERQRCEGMPEIVESDPRQPRSFQYLVEQTIRRDGTAGG